MMGTKLRAFAPLCNRSLEDLVPASNFYRHLEAKLDLGFVRDLVRTTYKECGRPSVDPRVFFKLPAYMHQAARRSSGKHVAPIGHPRHEQVSSRLPSRLVS